MFLTINTSHVNQVIYLLRISSVYTQSRVSTSFISSHLTQVVQPRLSSSPFARKERVYTMERKQQIIVTILSICAKQQIRILNHVQIVCGWRGVVRDCYTGQAEKVEGLARSIVKDDAREAVCVGKLLSVSAQ